MCAMMQKLRRWAFSEGMLRGRSVTPARLPVHALPPLGGRAGVLRPEPARVRAVRHERVEDQRRPRADERRFLVGFLAAAFFGPFFVAARPRATLLLALALAAPRAGAFLPCFRFAAVFLGLAAAAFAARRRAGRASGSTGGSASSDSDSAPSSGGIAP